MYLSQKISIIRKARRLTQEELGDKVGVTRQTVSDWEKGKYDPTLDSIRAIAQVLNVSYDALLNEDIDLNDELTFNRILKNLDNEIKKSVNNSFRYRIYRYNVKRFDIAFVICYFITLLISLTLCVIFWVIEPYKDMTYLHIIFLCICGVSLGLIPLCISKIKKIIRGHDFSSFGTLSETHLVIISRTDDTFDNTIYVPVTEVLRIELDTQANRRHGKVKIYLKNKNKVITTSDICMPQQLIDIFNNRDTFVDNSYGK